MISYKNRKTFQTEEWSILPNASKKETGLKPLGESTRRSL